jgi:hypothetical protein
MGVKMLNYNKKGYITQVTQVIFYPTRIGKIKKILKKNKIINNKTNNTFYFIYNKNNYNNIVEGVFLIVYPVQGLGGAYGF